MEVNTAPAVVAGSIARNGVVAGIAEIDAIVVIAGFIASNSIIV